MYYDKYKYQATFVAVVFTVDPPRPLDASMGLVGDSLNAPIAIRSAERYRQDARTA